MKTPSRRSGREGAERCLSGDCIPSKSRSKSQLKPAPVIVIDGCCVRIIAGEAFALGIPRRQSFAWPADALEYAQRLAQERDWPIDARGER